MLAGRVDPLARELLDAREHTLLLVRDLDDAQWMGPRLPIVNPILWEVGHVAWFQEYWTLRHPHGRPSQIASADALWDSARVAHDTRWDLPLPDRAATLRYLQATLDRSLAALDTGALYFHRLALFHEDMHGEAFTYTRQTLGYPAPSLGAARPAARGTLDGDAEVPGARFLLGATQDEPFVFDNEKWAHPVEVAPFRIARAPVTNAQYAEFVDAGGYRERRYWTAQGWRWRQAVGAERPLYWEPGFRERRYGAVRELAPNAPVIHVSWHEAQAFCAWARRRLPTEAEWELAAATPEKRRFPWGSDPPGEHRANLDGRAGDPVDVAAHPEGDSAYGCRQMIGNVWEWTASDFAPYPGFVADPYKEYSQPWFKSPHKVLRGGCWATRGRLLRNTFRNFYPPDRRDVLAGFRTCAR
ncbi:MAG TPA: selenoneine synthase SenA [Myxococcales bacterium]|nr:selenoneine synthase SenA [Myxococcales bacterium]